MEAVQLVQEIDLAPEEAGRQAVYAFLARVLMRSAKAEDVALAAPFAGDDTPLGKAFAGFSDALAAASARDCEAEFHDLFIGVGRGELLPYISYYLTGFLQEKPLAELRQDMGALGFVRAEGVVEPEDHIASLCDVMSELIAGTGRGEFDIYQQERFFSAHLKPWAQKFFADLEAAKSARVYRPIGHIGTIFMTIEEEGFAMVARA